MARGTQLEQDLKEVHYLLTRVILFLSKHNLENEVEAILKLKTTLPRPKKQHKTGVES